MKYCNLLILIIVFVSSIAYAEDGYIDERYLNARIATIEERLKGNHNVINTRFDDMDKATNLKVANEIEKTKSEFVRQTIYDAQRRDFENRLLIVETQSRTWLILIGLFFTVTQVITGVVTVIVTFIFFKRRLKE